MAEADLTVLRVATLIGRALRLHCPNCGAGDIFAAWGRLRKRCPECGLWLERGEGDYYLGAYMVALIVVEAFFAVGFIAVLVMTWPDPPWTAIQWIGALVLGVAVIVCYPFSKTVWLAIDLMFRPVTPDDLSADGPIETHGPATP
jgi:uncharacterized protein (DUF983 family)